jgi:hypothetical protein
LGPIFEADFEDSAYGCRPRRGAVDAIKETHRLICRGYTDVVDADLSKYLDRASYYTPAAEGWLKRSLSGFNTLRRKPFRRPRWTWSALISPRFTRCKTVCLETFNCRMV